MDIKVDFITLGGASEQLDVPAPTLRNWTDQLEEYDVHHTKRNHRNERIYYKEDIEVFRFIRDAKKKFGRKARTIDLANMLTEDGRFELRRSEEAPKADEESKEIKLLTQEEIRGLMDNEKVQQFIKIVVNQTTSSIKEDLIEEVNNSVLKTVDNRLSESEQSQREVLDSISKSNEKILSRIETYGRNSEKGFFARLFGK